MMIFLIILPMLTDQTCMSYPLEAQGKFYQRDMIQSSRYKDLSHNVVAFNASLSSNDVPKNFEEAIRDPKWKKAMEKEKSAFDKNETCEKCELPKGKKTVGCMQVYSIKYLVDGTIERYIARLVV